MEAIILSEDRAVKATPAPVLADELLNAWGDAFMGWRRLHPTATLTFEDYVHLQHSRVA